MVEIINIESLTIYILATIGLMAGIYLMRDWKLRRLTSLDAIDEAIRSCVERGKTVHFTPGTADPTKGRSYTHTLPASMEIWRYSCKHGGELRVPVIGSTEAPATQLMMQDYARNAYSEIGHPERYDPSQVYYFPGSQGAFGMIGLIHRENIGAHFSWGVFGGGTHLPLIAVANQKGAITIACNAYPMETAECALGADYPVIMEEEMASGVYLSEDPVQIASLCAEDILKIAFAIFPIVILLLYLAGVVPQYIKPM